MKANSGKHFQASWPVLPSLVLLAACDFGLDTLNIDPIALTSIESELQLNNAVVNSAPTLLAFTCEASIVKQRVRVFTGFGACGNFNVDARQATSENWNNGYETRVRALVDVIRTTEGDPTKANVYHAARIWRAYTFMRITDSYGNVPYTEAGIGFLDAVVFPAYDSQEFIYTSQTGILEELATATAALDQSSAHSRDVLYAGDVGRWKRLGNSLLLRAAMRLSKVRPELAEQYARRAVAGGLMQSNADNAVILHTSEFQNQPATVANGNESHWDYLTADFVGHLKEHNDPRLAAIAVRYAATSGGEQNEANAVRAPDQQIGMRMGFDDNTIGPVVQADGLSSFFAYSQIDRTRMMHPLAPSFLVTYAQTQLLLAEAVHRGWADGDVAALYESGIRAHMQQISTGYSGTAIAQPDIDAYVQSQALEPGRELERINTQYWIASFLIPDEAWANFRRSGYPRLASNPLRGSLQTEAFMRRFGYPDAERTVNPNTASQGVTPDNLDTRVWWDANDGA